MELTQTYKSATNSTNLRHSLRQFVLTLTDRHATVFESLSRASTPFGSNILAEGMYSTQSVSDNRVLLKRLTLMQDQLRNLNQQLNLLRDELSIFHRHPGTNQR